MTYKCEGHRIDQTKEDWQFWLQSVYAAKAKYYVDIGTTTGGSVLSALQVMPEGSLMALCHEHQVDKVEMLLKKREYWLLMVPGDPTTPKTLKKLFYGCVGPRKLGAMFVNGDVSYADALRYLHMAHILLRNPVMVIGFHNIAPKSSAWHAFSDFRNEIGDMTVSLKFSVDGVDSKLGVVTLCRPEEPHHSE